jgi:6-hydroxy-3-succinoylpyridine 3-monooxygenase
MPEEKHTDVNIAIQMVVDAFDGACDKMVLVSGDSDRVPAIKRVKNRFPDITILVYVPSRNPTRGAAVEMRSNADHARDLPLQLLKIAQFPAKVVDGAGGYLQKPCRMVSIPRTVRRHKFGGILPVGLLK